MYRVPYLPKWIVNKVTYRYWKCKTKKYILKFNDVDSDPGLGDYVWSVPIRIRKKIVVFFPFFGPV